MALTQSFCWAVVWLAIGHAAFVVGGEPSKAKPAGPSADDIHHAFRGRTAQPRWKLLQRLQRAGGDGDHADQIATLREELQQRFDDASAEVVDFHLLWQLSAYPSDDAAHALERFLSPSDPRVALTALQALLKSDRTPDWSQIPPLMNHAEDGQNYALRRAVIEAAERTESREAIDLLVETVAEEDGQLQYEAARVLTRRTGQKFGGDGAAWRKWWGTARKDFQPLSPEERPNGAGSEEMYWNKPVPKFFGVPIHARRLLFILDHSQSMASSVNGETRIDRARQELEKAILKLGPKTEFNVLIYNDRVESFSPRLAPATAARKREAILFAEQQTPELRTACYDALATGLDDYQELEAIYFLSDGEPTAGAIIDMHAIVKSITQQNQLKLVTIYTLGIDARGAHEQFLRDLAANNYGNFFLVR